MAQLCSVEEVKLYLDIQTTARDELLELIIDGASAQIESYTNRSFEVLEYTEALNGTGKNIIPVGHTPIVGVSSVVNAYGTQKDASFTNQFIVLKDGTVFTQGSMNWVVTYEAGYEEVPYDVRQACIELVSYKYKEIDRIGINSKTLAGEVVSFEKRDIRDSVKNLLANYVRVC